MNVVEEAYAIKCQNNKHMGYGKANYHMKITGREVKNM
jgi:hypothetical protein